MPQTTDISKKMAPHVALTNKFIYFFCLNTCRFLMSRGSFVLLSWSLATRYNKWIPNQVGNDRK